MSVLVLIDLKVKTELVESTKARLQEGLQDIRKFDGCEEALMHVNQDDSANLLFAERWTSRGNPSERPACVQTLIAGAQNRSGFKPLETPG